MTTNKRSYFKEQLIIQLQLLEDSCNLYDAGKKYQAVRIGTALRTLFHSTKNMTSLLKHMNISGIKLLSTCEERIPRGKTFWPNLTDIFMHPIPANPADTPNPEYRPKLDTARTKRFVAQSEGR